MYEFSKEFSKILMPKYQIHFEQNIRLNHQSFYYRIKPVHRCAE